ncbi:MAG: hypothetical protein KA146_10955 [Leptospiraceae bacterium]|nr:hypothetical protein [Leptospiraceae bacterium]
MTFDFKLTDIKIFKSKSFLQFVTWFTILLIECRRVLEFHGVGASLSILGLGTILFFAPQREQIGKVFGILLIGLSLSGLFHEKIKLETENYDSNLARLESQKEIIPTIANLETCNYTGHGENWLNRECALRNEKAKNQYEQERKRITEKNLSIESQINSLSRSIAFLDFFLNPQIYAHLLWSFLLPLIQIKAIPRNEVSTATREKVITPIQEKANDEQERNYKDKEKLKPFIAEKLGKWSITEIVKFTGEHRSRITRIRDEIKAEQIGQNKQVANGEVGQAEPLMRLVK